jgi:uncharacterized protein
MRPSVIVLAKEPVPGRAKTRLCPPCSPQQAATVAAAALADTLDAVDRTTTPRRVLAFDGTPPAWIPDGFEVIPQRAGNHAERIAGAFTDAGPPALLIGMDTPQVSAPVLDQCLDRLEAGSDAVLGLAADGGWWALGLHNDCGDLIRSVPTSTPTTGIDQLAALRGAGLAVGDLLELRDVDTWPDALEVSRLCPGSRFARAVAAVAVSEPVR